MVVVLSAVAVGAAAVAPSTIPAGASVRVCGGEREREGGGGHKVSGRRTLPAALNGRVIVVVGRGRGLVGGGGGSLSPPCRGERERVRERAGEGSQRKWEKHLSRKFETPLVELSP